MINREQWRDFSRSKPVRTSLFVVGLILIILSPIAGAIPGPGGVFVFAAGLALSLKNSEWAKRQYVRFKRKQPQAGRWADWGLRRRSARRREALRKQLKERQALRENSGAQDAIPEPPNHPPETWAEREGRAERPDAAD